MKVISRKEAKRQQRLKERRAARRLKSENWVKQYFGRRSYKGSRYGVSMYGDNVFTTVVGGIEVLVDPVEKRFHIKDR